ncbi:MAG: hypothetical protein HYZ15_15100 [Sphingobacteriales bacterium]|nr:hypothetical protein [Sphingobacteriales bacterium]
MKKIFLSMMLATALALPSLAQPINLDRPVKAGELTCFPDIGNENQYYYISDKPHLARGTDGKPQFSFLRYAENKVSGADQPGTEAEGGGIVHAVVSLEVTQDQIREAQRELQRLKPNAQLLGPVVYKSGKFGIVSSFKDPQGGLSKQVVGLGNAPVLDGQKAAVSIQLTRQGAKILWESFNTVAPDISFTFEMEVAGYRSPKKAVIEANFDQIYDHKAFNVGLATTFLAAEIKGTFDDLVRSGAIKVTQIGEDEKMEAMIATAYNKISDMMFAPMNGTGNLGLNELGGITGGNSTSVLDRATTMLRDSRAEARAVNLENDRRRAAEDERQRNLAPRDTSRGRGAIPDSRVAGSAPPEDRPSVGARSAGVTPPSGSTRGANSANAGPNIQDVSMPTFAVVATFEMKRIHQQGIFRIDLNKSTADNISMRFDENIGDLTGFRNDNTVFRQVNLDDPLYIQRELTAFIDGMNAQDFGQYINFVNLRLKKTHQGGDITNQEIRIDRNNFNKEGNNFKMVYGWKQDNDRKKWMDYEYEAEWSFFGGKTVKVPLQKSTSGAIDLTPPYQRRSVEFQADQAALTNAGVRLVTVKVFYKLGDAEQQKQVTLNPAKGQLSEKAEFMLPGDSYDYEYEVTWRMGNNQTKSSGRVKSNEAIVFVDQITN